MDSSLTFTVACKRALPFLMTRKKLASASGWKSETKTHMGSGFDVHEAVGTCIVDVSSRVSAEDADKLAAISAKKCGQS